MSRNISNIYPEYQMEYNLSLLDSIEKEAVELANEHYVGHTPKEWFEMSLDLESLRDALVCKDLFVVTAHEDEELAGYALFSVGPSLMVSNKEIANVHALFVDRLHRCKGVAKGLVQFVEELPSVQGVVLCMPDTPTGNSVAQAFGYTKSEAIYVKRLEE